MSESSQEEKQNFLREKILEKGYDTNQFVQFLIDEKRSRCCCMDNEWFKNSS